MKHKRFFVFGAVFVAFVVLFLAGCKMQENIAGQAGEAVTSCVDEDGGKVYDVRGSATGIAASVNTPSRAGVVAGNIYELEDKCTRDGRAVKELYCNENKKLAEEIYDCPLGCENGACKLPTCSDSDGGDNIYVAGTRIKDAESRTDYCVDSDTVMEYICSPYQGVARDCPTGKCENGACVCNDPDGEDYTTQTTSKGKDSITGAVVTRTDSCSANTLTEWYCEGNILTSRTITCDGNCQNGKCTRCKAGNIKYENGDCIKGENKWTCRGGTAYRCSINGTWELV